MTTYGWDASHFDGALSLADLQQAKAQGIELFTHKLGEGANHADDDSTAADALVHARSAGVSVLGGYWFCHGDSPAVAQADLFVTVADAMVPWWRQHPHWFWQPDCETEAGHGKPSPSWIAQFSDRLAQQTGRLVVVYASHGQYGDTLAGLGHPLWNANYPSSRADQFKALYPGDSYAGWTKYSGQVPVLAQYSSSATIAGKTTCDANAFRGTLAQLIDFFSGGTDVALQLSPEDLTALAEAVWTHKPGWAGLLDETPLGMLNDVAIRTNATTNTQLPALASAVATVQSQANSNGSGITALKTALASLTPGQATTVAGLSDADIAKVVKAVLDGFAARQQA